VHANKKAIDKRVATKAIDKWKKRDEQFDKRATGKAIDERKKRVKPTEEQAAGKAVDEWKKGNEQSKEQSDEQSDERAAGKPLISGRKESSNPTSERPAKS